MERAAVNHDLCCNPGFNVTAFSRLLNGDVNMNAPINQDWTNQIPDFEKVKHLDQVCERDAESGACKFTACTNNLLRRAEVMKPDISLEMLLMLIRDNQLQADRLIDDQEVQRAGNRRLVRLSCQETEGETLGCST